MPNPDNNIKNHSKVLNLELAMVNAWQKQAGWLWLLWPLSILYGVITYIRRKLYKKGILFSYQAPIPVLVVGNITIGGSGKTPLIIELVDYLKSKGVKVGVISRGYGGDESLMPQLVTLNSKPEEVGDEPFLIVRETGAAVAVCPNRQQAIQSLLVHQPDLQLIIADDGLQHYKLHRDIEWVVVDSARGFGNKQLLPTGFLREPLGRLKGTTVIYHQRPVYSQLDTKSEPVAKEDKKLVMHLQPVSLQPLTPNQTKPAVDEFNSVYAVSGIGYPQRFFNTLHDLGYEVTAKPMPDHHQFRVEDLIALGDKPIVITSKDAVKIAPLVQSNPKLQKLSIWVLPVKAVLSANSYTKLNQQLNSFGIKV